MLFRKILSQTIREISQHLILKSRHALLSTTLLNSKENNSNEIIEDIKYANSLKTFSSNTKPIVLEHDTADNEISEINGIPEEHQYHRKARIFRSTRNVLQSGWGKTEGWKIELDNRHRWENPNMGWCSNGDPLSNISMALIFASQEDAIAFCEKNKWPFEVEKTQDREIIPKSYGINYSWNKRSRVSTK